MLERSAWPVGNLKNNFVLNILFIQYEKALKMAEYQTFLQEKQEFGELKSIRYVNNS